MKILENVTVYQCDFCPKKLYVKGAMSRHIKNCAKNPENIKACFDCEHLIETEVEYTRFGYNGFCVTESEEVAKGFKCTLLNKLVYPPKVERKKLHEKWPETFCEQEPMPKICGSQEKKYLL